MRGAEDGYRGRMEKRQQYDVEHGARAPKEYGADREGAIAFAMAQAATGIRAGVFETTIVSDVDAGRRLKIWPES